MAAVQSRTRRIRDALTPGEWSRVGGMVATVGRAACRSAGACSPPPCAGTTTSAGRRSSGRGPGILAYTLGMRHAFDADHIAAIDNTTRKLVRRGQAAAVAASNPNPPPPSIGVPLGPHPPPPPSPPPSLSPIRPPPHPLHKTTYGRCELLGQRLSWRACGRDWSPCRRETPHAPTRPAGPPLSPTRPPPLRSGFSSPWATPGSSSCWPLALNFGIRASTARSGPAIRRCQRHRGDRHHDLGHVPVPDRGAQRGRPGRDREGRPRDALGKYGDSGTRRATGQARPDDAVPRPARPQG